MFWIYVLKCENDMYYVGLTQHLYKRLAKHYSGEACKNTRDNKVIEIAGLYKGSNNFKFNKYLTEYYGSEIPNKERLFKILDNFDYDSNILKEDIESIENFVTEHMHRTFGHDMVRGGKYLRGKETNIEDYSLHDVRDKCCCGLPCEVLKRIQNKKVKFIYVCSLRNVWDGMRNDFKLIPIRKPCQYHEEFLDDIEFRVNYTQFSN